MFCLAKECNHKVYAKGYCQHHYDKDRRHDSPFFKRSLKKNELCTFAGCLKNQTAKLLCHTHYMKLKRSGSLVYSQVYGEASKEKSRARTAKWKKDNWDYYRAYLNSRKKRVKQATPGWSNKIDIINFYKNCPNGFHVDHIIPINGKNVTGLHVIYNLQYLSKIENLKKGSKFNIQRERPKGIQNV